MRPTFLLIAVLVLLGMTAVACTDGEQPAAPPDPSPDTTATVQPPAPPSQETGPSVALAEVLENAQSGDARSLLQRLNEPQRIETEPQQNRHVPGQMDTLRTYHYGGLTITVYDVAGSGRSMISQIQVSQPGFETAEGLRVGSSRSAVEAALGPPDEQQEDTYIYDLGDVTPHPLHITFDDDTVQQMTWHFYID